MHIDISKYVLLARADQALSDRAWEITADLLHGVTSEHKVRSAGVRGSDAGKCSEELRCILAGEPQVPDDPLSMLHRLDAGTLIGARIQALFKVGYESATPGYSVELEASGEALGVPCHADIAVYAPHGGCVFSADVKTGYFPGKPKSPWQPDSPKDDHTEYIYQACHQALSLGAPDFGVHMVAMADGNYKGEPPIYGQTFTFRTQDWENATRREYARLGRATGQEHVPCDFNPAQTWRVRFCKNLNCPRRMKAVVNAR